MKFITEFFNRFSLKTPPFFQMIQKISIITTIIAGIPALIGQFQTDLNIVLPAFITSIALKVVAWSGMVAWVVAKLPVSNPTSPVVSQQLPFTDKN